MATEQSVMHRLRDRIDTVARERPARLVVVVFAGIILIVTLVLFMPIAKVGPGGAGIVDAFFTAVSAVCVTGLVVVDTATYWTGIGQSAIALGMMVGGLGVMTLASILGMAVSRHIGLTQRMLTATETKSRLGEVGSLIRAVLIISLSVEALLTVVLLPTFLSMGEPLLEAIGHSAFMAISIFNNGGFVIIEGGLAPFIGNWGLGLPIILGTIVGAIGFPVVLDVARTGWKFRRWTLHTKLTITTYAVLWVATLVGFVLFEIRNQATLGSLNANDTILASLLQATTPRSSGLSTIDVADMTEPTWFLFDALMFVGGGSASTAGGIKVSTFAVLVLAIVAEARGDRDLEAFGWRIPSASVRLAVAAAFLGATIVGAGTLTLLHITGLPLDVVLFECISAFATCGLSTGITGDLPSAAKIVLSLLMFLGRIGTMTFAAALALRERRKVIRLPQERPIIG